MSIFLLLLNILRIKWKIVISIFPFENVLAQKKPSLSLFEHCGCGIFLYFCWFSSCCRCCRRYLIYGSTNKYIFFMFRLQEIRTNATYSAWCLQMCFDVSESHTTYLCELYTNRQIYIPIFTNYYRITMFMLRLFLLLAFFLLTFCCSLTYTENFHFDAITKLI